jgi:hypothetical protein
MYVYTNRDYKWLAKLLCTLLNFVLGYLVLSLKIILGNIALGENHSGHATKILFPQHVRHLAILLMPFDFPTPNTFKSFGFPIF